jgi:hypothetical protein
MVGIAASQPAAPQAPAVTETLRDLPEALDRMVGAAAEFAGLPLGGPQADHVGYIESLCRARDGSLWLFGWMRLGQPLHFPGMLTDGNPPVPAATVLAHHARADLPADAVAICGPLRTAWQPTPGTKLLRLYFGDGAQRFLHGLETVEWLTEAQGAARLAMLAPKLEGPFARAIRRQANAVFAWGQDNAAAAAIGLRAHAERVLVIPGFGCIAEGWVLSPLQPAETLLLRVGDHVLKADPASIGRRARPDLLPAVPGAHRLVQSAGYVAAFPGEIDPDGLDEVTLKVVTEDGTGFAVRVEPSQLRVLGHSAHFEDILAAYPMVRREAFFPALARGIGQTLRQAAGRAMPVEVHPAPTVLVVAIPDDRDDTALLKSDLARLAEERPRPPPLVALLRANDNRAAALDLLAEQRAALGQGCSLFLVPDSAYALHALATVLDQVAADRFAFLAPGIFPDPAAWAALLGWLGSEETGPFAVPVWEVATAPPRPGAAPLCFAWRRAPFLAWLRAQPVLLGGLGAAGLRLPPETMLATGPMARRGRRLDPGLLAAPVNEVLMSPLSDAADAPPYHA